MTAEQDTTRIALEDLQRLHVALLLQLDQLDHDIRRLRWWTLTIAILLLVLTILWRVA